MPQIQNLHHKPQDIAKGLQKDRSAMKTKGPCELRTLKGRITKRKRKNPETKLSRRLLLIPPYNRLAQKFPNW